MDKSRTLSQTTATGNVRTVRLNTYRERKRECQELQKETEQLSNTVYELQGIYIFFQNLINSGVHIFVPMAPLQFFFVLALLT